MPLRIHRKPTKPSGLLSKGSKSRSHLSFQPLNKEHLPQISDFDCGDDTLNEFIHQKAIKEQTKNFSRVFLGFDDSGNFVSYFSLSTASIKRNSLPRNARPPYSVAPGILLGRLAVDLRYQKSGYGAETLLEVISKYIEVCSITGSVALLVEAYEKVAEFYKQFKFQEIKEGRKDQKKYISMYLLTETIINEF